MLFYVTTIFHLGKYTCTSCAVVLGIVIAFSLAFVAVAIFWVVGASQRSHQNVSLSTYKEALSLSHATDHLFLEDVCVSASDPPPPNPTQITIAAIECSSPNMIDTSFHFQGVLIKGQQSSPGLVNHDLAFYWNRGTVVNLVTSIPFETYEAENFTVTLFILTDENTFMRCSTDHKEPKEGFHAKWSVSPNSSECENTGNTFTCNFTYNVIQSNIHYICFIRKKAAEEHLNLYTYTLTGELKTYNISQAETPKHCDLKHSNSCCAKYGSVFKGLSQKTCIIITTDIPNEAMHPNDVGVIFTVTVLSSRRFSVVWLPTGLAVLCIITALVLTVLCVVTVYKGRNRNIRN